MTFHRLVTCTAILHPWPAGHRPHPSVQASRLYHHLPHHVCGHQDHQIAAHSRCLDLNKVNCISTCRPWLLRQSHNAASHTYWIGLSSSLHLQIQTTRLVTFLCLHHLKTSSKVQSTLLPKSLTYHRRSRATNPAVAAMTDSKSSSRFSLDGLRRRRHSPTHRAPTPQPRSLHSRLGRVRW